MATTTLSVRSEESLHLLATCYYRSGKTAAAYSILTKSIVSAKSSDCRLLLAKCCLDLKKFTEAEEALISHLPSYDSCKGKNHASNVANFSTNNISTPSTNSSGLNAPSNSSSCPLTCKGAFIASLEDLTAEYEESAAFVAQMLGQIAAKTEREAKAIEYFHISLKLNPFLWTSFEALVQLGHKVEADKIFDVSTTDFSYCTGGTRLSLVVNQSSTGNKLGAPVGPNPNSLCENSSNTTAVNQPFPSSLQQIFIGSFVTPSPGFKSNQRTNSIHEKPLCYDLSITSSPLAIIKTSEQAIDAFTPENQQFASLTSVTCAPVKQANPHSTSTTTGSVIGSVNNATIANNTSSNSNNASINNPNGNNNNSSSNGNSGNSVTASNLANASKHLPNRKPCALRRSSRLFNSSSSVKENTSNKSTSVTSHRNFHENDKRKSASVVSHIRNDKTPAKKQRKQTTSTSTVTTDSLKGDPENTNPLASSTTTAIGKSLQNSYSSTAAPISYLDAKDAVNRNHRASSANLMLLLKSMGNAVSLLGQYKVTDAIAILKSLPIKQKESGFIQCLLGRCYTELCQYWTAIEHYAESRKVEPHRLEGVEHYSTALWHVQKEVQLSLLSQELIAFDRTAPQTWCVAGNCFSLQKEHETAIKFLQRAIQVDPDFAYAYTLLGHEYVATEEMDHAMQCFRSAVKIDPRHYNAWYGIGMIYQKQEKYEYAEVNFRRALSINSNSPVLTAHLGVVLMYLKKMDLALNALNDAIKLDPSNSFCLFHRATHLFAMERHEEALEELEKLKLLVPKESILYFMIGKVHKKLGNTHLALMNFSWATDLDPKGANNLHKEIYANLEDNQNSQMLANDTSDLAAL